MKYIPSGKDDSLMPSNADYTHAGFYLLSQKAKQDILPEIIVAREFDEIQTPADYNDMQCFGGKSFLSLKPNGNITPCSDIDDMVCGNIIRDSVESIWNSKKMLDFSEDFYNPYCPHAYKCAGGCKAVSRKIHGEISCDDYCWTIR
jgi:radical SAM protein with 4Fe4S-binding SPASM domain